MNTITRQDLNMATTRMLNFIQPPDKFDINDDPDIFKAEMENFFKMAEIPEEIQPNFVRAFMKVEAIKKYDACIQDVNWKIKFDTCFKRKSSLLEDLSEALSYRKNDENVDDFFKKVRSLTKKVFEHEITEENFEKFLIDNALNDAEMRKDYKMHDLKEIDQIKSHLTKIEKLRKEEENVSVVNQLNFKPGKFRSHYNKAPDTSNARKYSEVVRSSYSSNANRPNNYSNSNNESNRPNNYPNSNNTRQQSRIQTQKNYIATSKRCWACRDFGHLRRDCPNISCNHCKKRGHFRY